MFPFTRLWLVLILVLVFDLTPERLARSVTVRVLFLYTPEAVTCTQGCPTALRTAVERSFRDAREIFRRENVRLELAGFEPTRQSDDNAPSDRVLRALCAPRSPWLGQAASRARDRTHADLVCLVVGRGRRTDRGWATVPKTRADLLGGTFAFCVVRATQLREGDLTLCHELAHTFGCTHERARTWWVRGGQVGTVTSRSPRRRVPLWSGPNAAVLRRHAGVVSRHR